MLSPLALQTVTVVILIASLISCYFHGNSATSDKSHFGVDDWKSKELHEFFNLKCGVKIDLELVSSLSLTGHDLFDNHVIDENFLLNKLLVNKSKDRAKILAEIDSLDEALTLRPNDVFEWRAANRVLFRFLFSLGHHGQVLWLRFYEHEGAGALNQFDDFIDDMDNAYFWPIWAICPTYFHFSIASKMDMHQSYLDEYLVWSYGLFTLIAAMDFLTKLIRAVKLSKGSLTTLFNNLIGYVQGYATRVFVWESILLLSATSMKSFPIIPVFDDFMFFMTIYCVGPAYLILIANNLVIDLGQTLGLVDELGHHTSTTVPKKVPSVGSPVSATASDNKDGDNAAPPARKS